MTSFIGNKLTYSAKPEQIAGFFGDMQNFKKIMPEQIENWSANESSCSFFIKNLGNLGMYKGDFDTPNQFGFPSNEQSKVKFTLLFKYRAESSGEAMGHFEILAEMSALVEMMARRPLTNFVNILTKNFREVCN